MTLADAEVQRVLRERFVVGWRNVWREQWVGQSRGYRRDQCAVGTTNGAGGRNMQVFVLAPDLTVLHALPGFWHPDDFVAELRFAEGLAAVWRDPALSRSQKDALFAKVQLAEPGLQGAATRARSGWQGFDRHAEYARGRCEPRDTFTSLPLPGVLGGPASVLQPLNVLVHRRMAERPFVPFAEFDVAAFTDYGRPYYDNNVGRGDEGVDLPRPPLGPRPANHWL